MKNKKILIAGGSGFIGQEISRYFGIDNEIVILTRKMKDVKTNAFGNSLNNDEHNLKIRYIEWDGRSFGKWSNDLNDVDIVINLAGKSVNCRYTEKNKREIFDSRTDPTKIIGKAIRASANPPALWINASSATIYRHATDKPQDEYTGEIENDFSVQVCKKWEKTFYEEHTPNTRKVALRMAINLGPGGILTPYFNLLKFGLGGRQGNGRQMYSWIHVDDTCRIIEWIYENKHIEGTFNCCSPNPVPNENFMQKLRNATGHKIGLPAYTWMLKIGTAIIGTETELVLKSRWVIPTKLLQNGFVFKYPLLEDAFKDIISKTPRKKYHLF